MERFRIINVWYGPKYTPEVVQDSKISLKWINTKIMEKTVDFINVDLVEDIPTYGVSLDIRRGSLHMYY